MIVGAVGLVDETQRQPAGEEFELGEDRTAGQAVPCRQAIGELDIAGGQRVAAQALALVRPGHRPHQIFRRMVEDGDGLVVMSLAVLPAHALVEQAGIALQRRRHRRQRLVAAARQMGELEPGVGERAIIGADIGIHPLCGVDAAVPQQPVESRDLVLLAQHAMIALQQRLLLEDAEVAVDPDVADAVVAVILAAEIDPDLCLPQLARRRHRREAVVPFGHRLVGDAGGRFIGMLAQRREAWPVRVGGDEVADIAEGSAAAVARKVEPPQHLGKEAVLCLVGVLSGARPVAGADRLKRLAVDLAVARAELRARRRRGRRDQEEGEQECQTTCEQPHRPQLPCAAMCGRKT